MNIHFAHWQQQHPNFMAGHVQNRDGDQCKWGRLVCTWKQKMPNGKIREHKYGAGLYKETGDLYVDYDKIDIYMINLALAIYRPVQIVAKTAYHASMLGVAYEIFNYATDHRDTAKLKERCIRQLKDIVRTPLYGLALSVIHIAGVFAGLLMPNKIYDIRKLVGDTENKLNWGEKGSFPNPFHTMAPCCQPVGNLTNIDRIWGQDRKDDTLYAEGENSDTLAGMTNLARAYIVHNGHHYKTNPYISDCLT